MFNKISFDYNPSSLNNARFWMEREQGHVKIHYSPYSPNTKGATDNLEKLAAVINNYIITQPIADIPQDTRSNFIEKINNLIVKHNSKLDTNKNKFISCLLNLPVLNKIFSIFVNTEKFKTYKPLILEPFREFDALKDLEQKYLAPISSQKKPDFQPSSPLKNFPVELLDIKDWDSLSKKINDHSHPLFLYEPIRAGFGLLIYKNPQNQKITRFLMDFKADESILFVDRLKNIAEDFSKKPIENDFYSHRGSCSLTVLPDLSDINASEWSNMAISEVIKKAGRGLWDEGRAFYKQNQSILTQLEEYYRNWIYSHWSPNDIQSRFWEMVEVSAAAKAHRGYVPWENSNPCEWLIQLLTPLVTTIPASAKTEQNLRYFAERIRKVDDYRAITINDNAWKLFNFFLAESNLSNSNTAAHLLKYSSYYNFPLLWSLLLAGTKEKELSPEFTKEEPESVQNSSLFLSFINQLDENPLSISIPIFYHLVKTTQNLGQTKNKYSDPALEKIYLSSFSREFKFKCLFILIYLGTPVSQKQMDRFKRDLELGDLSLLQILYDKGHLTEQEYNSYKTKPVETFEKATSQEIEALLNRTTNEIKRMAKRTNLGHDALDFSKVSEWRKRKKDAKKALKSHPQIQKAFDEFCKTYDSLVDKHPVLSLLRKVSKDIKSIQQGSDKSDACLRKMISIWANLDHTALKADKTPQKIRSEPFIRYGIYDRVTSVAARYFKDPLWYACRRVWWHGTKIITHQMVSKLPEKQLLATGTLFKKRIAPLCGELCGSHTHINGDKLSGVMASTRWDQEHDRYGYAGSDLLISILYASKQQLFKTMVFDPEEAWKLINVNTLEALIAAPDVGKLTELQVAILRVRMTDREADLKLQPFREAVKKAAQNDLYGYSVLPELLETLEKPPGIFLEPEDLKMMTNPYPLLYGCPDQQPAPHYEVKNMEWYPPQNKPVLEYLMKDGLTLGKEIKIALTEKKHLADLTKTLEGSGVRAEEFDMGLLIETMEMLKGSKAEPSHLKSENMSHAQIQISSRLQQDVLPLYAARLPKDPVYIENGRTLPVLSPRYGAKAADYKQYLSLLEQDAILPRDYHGCMHAARTTMWSQMLAVLYERHGTVIKEPVLLGVTAGAHDSARQDEGVDCYEDESAANLSVYLNRYGLPQNIIDYHVQAIKDKDPKNGKYETPVQEIVHNADCLEIIRCLEDFSRFDPERLSFTHIKGLDKDYLNKLILEVKDFIEQTEALDIKQDLEWNSQEYYLDLLRLFKKMHAEKQSYPVLFDLMKGFLPQ